jgi:hypothetical protein
MKYLGNFIHRLNPRAKALGPNQNKNPQIQFVKLPMQKVFLKLKNLFDKKIRSCYLFYLRLIPTYIKRSCSANQSVCFHPIKNVYRHKNVLLCHLSKVIKIA